MSHVNVEELESLFEDFTYQDDDLNYYRFKRIDWKLNRLQEDAELFQMFIDFLEYTVDYNYASLAKLQLTV